jgi:hypothetical protein
MAIDQDLAALALWPLIDWGRMRRAGSAPSEPGTATEDPLIHRLAGAGNHFTAVLRRSLSLTWRTLKVLLARDFLQDLCVPGLIKLQGRDTPAAVYELDGRVAGLDPLKRRRCFLGLRNSRQGVCRKMISVHP